MFSFCYSAFKSIAIYNVIYTKKSKAHPWLLINKVQVVLQQHRSWIQYCFVVKRDNMIIEDVPTQ